MTPDQHRFAAEQHIAHVDRLLARLAAIPPRRTRPRATLTDEAHTRCLAAWVHLRAADTQLRDRVNQLRADLDDAHQAAAAAADQHAAAAYLHTQAVAEQCRLAERLADANRRLAGTLASEPGWPRRRPQAVAGASNHPSEGYPIPTPLPTPHSGAQPVSSPQPEPAAPKPRTAAPRSMPRLESPSVTETGQP